MINLTRTVSKRIMEHYLSEGWEPVHKVFFEQNSQKLISHESESIPVSTIAIDVVNDLFLAIDEWKSIFDSESVIFEPHIDMDENDNILFDGIKLFNALDYVGNYTCIMGISIVTSVAIYNLTISSKEEEEEDNNYFITQISKNNISSSFDIFLTSETNIGQK